MGHAPGHASLVGVLIGECDCSLDVVLLLMVTCWWGSAFPFLQCVCVECRVTFILGYQGWMWN